MSINQRSLYWLLNLAGWLAMMAIEVLNYTFFIVGRFDWRYVITFGYYAFLGFFLMHGFRTLVKRMGIFEWRPRRIWLFAIASTIILSVVFNLLSTLPYFFAPGVDVSGLFSFIQILGGTLNLVRYVGVWVIIYFLFHILERSHQLKEAHMLSESIAREIELEMLKSQLNPHFLFNALNSIKALASIDPEKCKDAIVKLSELLRFTLQSGNHKLIPLHDEMEEVKKYLNLEQIRFGKRFQVHITVDEEAQGQLIPPAMILTLAENAIKHGITRHPGASSLGIKATFQQQILQITMTNSGKIEQREGTGFGLKNVRTRLAHIFGSRAVFSLDEEDASVKASITIHA